ncbi:DUF6414 family protein [Micropruina sonneratiae]|uniref:DUF6414 family protein n=1 Tax=Micropruina sonneratiae TaxID=2986940 RepID=UPI0022263655|nr:hypothetical protein [Micropruina sp. KQZ13P-5]MCW3158638.1 hypothetical protein [Micropruina sp. KQZ13P-5]
MVVFLREYIYVDVDRVSGLAGQLYDGIPEKAINVAGRRKRAGFDLKVLSGSAEVGAEEQTERNLADGLFKDLEADLETLGMLSDLSTELAESETWNSIEDIARAGQIVRITSPGTLFHPKQISDAIVGIATAAVGLHGMGITGNGEVKPVKPIVPPKAKTPAQKKAERDARSPRAPAQPIYPEDYLPAEEIIPVMGTERTQLAGLIRITRGVFQDGAHLMLRPLGAEGPIISTRLEAGRRFMDSSPEILFSRYGLAEQEWTVVGIIGQFGSRIAPAAVVDVTDPDGSVNRGKFVDLVGNFLATSRGMVDLPSAPGFSLIPLAVYRGIGYVEDGES